MRWNSGFILNFLAMVILSSIALAIVLLPVLPSKSVGNHWAIVTDKPMQVHDGRHGVGAWRFARLDDGQEGTLRLPMGEAIPEPGTRLCVEAVQPGVGALLRLRRIPDQVCGPDPKL
jgi:hypothetical protein